jgi:nucleoid DNA-binding protein
MRNKWLLAGGVVATLAILGLGFAGGVVYSQRQEIAALEQQVARRAGVAEATVIRVLKAFGPVAVGELKKGNELTLGGLGVLRVVRVAEHRDLRNGRPVVIPAVNYVEFVPTADLASEANDAAVRPNETVPEFKYTPLPNQTPSQRTGKIRVPPVRTR